MKDFFTRVSTENPGRLVMELTPALLDEIAELFDIRTELIMGTCNQRPDGMFDVDIEITSQEKADLIKDFILSIMTKDIKTNN